MQQQASLLPSTLLLCYSCQVALMSNLSYQSAVALLDNS